MAVKQIRQAYRSRDIAPAVGLDQGIVLATAGPLALDIVTMTSTSMVVADSYSLSRWHYLVRHLFYIGVRVGLAAGLRFVSIAHLKRLANLAFPAAVLLLLLPFVPGLGHKVNGAVRWIDIGVVRLQVVEPVKLLVIFFMAAYLARDRKGGV